MSLFNIIPNLITLLNGFSGCMALLSLFEGDEEMSLIWVIIAVIFDVLDGFFSRLFSSASDIGKQLDSLCDVISFGLAPGFFMHFYLLELLPYHLAPLSIFSFLITISAIYRLARFNITSSSLLYFEGLPTPAFALFVVGIPFIPIQINPIIISILVFLLAILMVSNFKLPSQKFKSGKPSNFILIFSLFAILVLMYFKFQAISAIVLAYAFFGFLYIRFTS